MNNPDMELVKHGQEMASGFRMTGWMDTLIFQMFFYFPGFERIMPVVPEGYDAICRISREIIAER